MHIYKKLNFILLKKYALAVVCVICWTIYHQSKTGWFLFSPLREDTHEAMVSGSMMFKQFFYSVWKLIDFGRIGLWLIFIFSFFIYIKNKSIDNSKTIFALVFIPLLILLFGMIPLGNPIGHKYFIVIFLLLNIAFCFALQQLSDKISNTIFVFCSILLISGNFWIYPSKYGNGWDASLKVIPFFELKEKMDDYIASQNISPEDVGTQFPLIANKTESDLVEDNFQYQNVWAGPIYNYNYFLYSNVINTDIPEQFDEAIKTWEPIKTFQAGLVEISLYKNSTVVATTSNQHLH